MSRKYTGREFAHCDRCPNPAGQLVMFHDDTPAAALCFTCWHPIKSTCKVLHWINRYGRIMFAPGATTGPFKINHP
jgi:hypothetical protein